MEIFRNKKEVKQFLSENLSEKSLGFVPTMGALHEGHIALIEKAIKENDYCICSIFVNPLQFNRKEDLDTYPDRIKEDSKMLADAGCQLLYLPTVDDIYHDQERLNYDFGSIGKGMEAEYRPGHFEGVAEVIHRFFSILKPSRAYFGEKDYQQLAIIRWLVETYDHETEVVPCATVRNEDGLAMSSRNYNLSRQEYSKASKIYEVLNFCREEVGNYSPPALADLCLDMLKEDFKPEYFTIADELSMIPLQNWEDSERPRAFVAAYCGDVRLIDNLSLKGVK